MSAPNVSDFYQIAINGSTFAARRAGIKQASREVKTTSNVMIAKVTGSFALTPNSRVSINLINPIEFIAAAEPFWHPDHTI